MASEGIGGRGMFNRCPGRVQKGIGWHTQSNVCKTLLKGILKFWDFGVLIAGACLECTETTITIGNQGLYQGGLSKQQFVFDFCSTDSHYRCYRTGVIWSNLRRKDNIRAALVWQSCSWDILGPFAPQRICDVIEQLIIYAIVGVSRYFRIFSNAC